MKHIKTRIFSFIALAALATGCGTIVGEGFYVATDSFIAPAMIGPTSDLVLDAKLKLSTLLLEKGKAQILLEEDNADIEAGDAAIIKLNGLKDVAKNALSFTKTTTGYQISIGSSDLNTLASQKATLNQMLDRQQSITDEAKKNLDAGLIQKSDYIKEVQQLDVAQVALFENERSRMQTNLLLGQASLTQQSMNTKNGSVPTPEMMISADELVRLEVELLQTEAIVRAKHYEREQIVLELAKIDDLQKDLMERPLFRAMNSQLDMAFVSYSGLKDITPNAKLEDCIWGIFKCHEVGTVVEIIPSEVILPDVFTSGQTRGQFITLKLDPKYHDEAMQSKILRVRGEGKRAQVEIKKPEGNSIAVSR